MDAAWKKAAPFAALTLAALTLTACLVAPAPHAGGGAYYQPAPVYVGPRYYHGPRYFHGPRYYHGPRYHHKRWHHWQGGGWHGDNR